MARIDHRILGLATIVLLVTGASHGQETDSLSQLQNCSLKNQRWQALRDRVVGVYTDHDAVETNRLMLIPVPKLDAE